MASNLRRTLGKQGIGLALAASLAACGVVPFPGGSGTARPSGPLTTVPPAAGAAPRAVADALLAAWRSGNTTRVDALANDPAAATATSPYQLAPTTFVACTPDAAIPAAKSCSYLSGDKLVVIVTQRTERGRWGVVAIRFRPFQGSASHAVGISGV